VDWLILKISGLAFSGLKKISGLAISGLRKKLAMPASGNEADFPTFLYQLACLESCLSKQRFATKSVIRNYS
jgi:hypothetical protein